MRHFFPSPLFPLSLRERGRGEGPRPGDVALDDALGGSAGELLARARSSDVIDASLILLADDGDRVLTSDLDDLAALAAAAGRHVELIRT